MKTMTSREFNQHVGRAQREAQAAPVIVTNRSKPVFVFLTYADYQKLAGRKQSALDVLLSLDCPDVSGIDFEVPARSRAQRKPVDLSMEG
ncbi:type II toxin-antitoxin system Phd/YefM family antitoxin [Neisseria sp. N95_16]|uniref:Antitoxin n=1 Tax=Neisseria brasiliensis TaxID=2666100 RepID=A0A5Q3RZD9_9NEIS|nr:MULTISPECIES: type II toxin-antitoxin system Phd/YefM family antitoxin [Neisseria]MRN38321.1 type II toxin-antitoxin system prevent-host-death family antitoxin [Neisseria brasiliensis]PJO10271.1 type II toxin-antitoxin system Phd/YefM family antitoxin [Neisseria sp. N95_16]PJO77131.1 type II toxin-antitoxin system Phd/YefM family antitoxin [Neisseria sp. N177_16]QGL25317.1 type II toxin-antitoxin system prevent-host-death family antitoxin [Neisseria brasiliensis]